MTELTIEQAKLWHQEAISSYEKFLAKQLLATMHENGRLRQSIRAILPNLVSWSPGIEESESFLRLEELSNEASHGE